MVRALVRPKRLILWHVSCNLSDSG
ncbi:hypothetical protein JMJ77_0013853, partial [Colletotrichum scovillei]